MAEEKREMECNMDSIIWLGQRFAEAKFCKQECPVPQNKRGWGCGCRPISYMKECPVLNRYNKKNKKGEKK